MRHLNKYLLPILLCAAIAPAQAAMVSTPDLAATQPQAVPAAERQAARDQLRLQLIEAGVAPADAAQRIERLTDAQVAAVQGEIDALPAGAGLNTTTLLLIIIIIILLV
jgi:hypothetical protein